MDSISLRWLYHSVSCPFLQPLKAQQPGSSLLSEKQRAYLSGSDLRLLVTVQRVNWFGDSYTGLKGRDGLALCNLLNPRSTFRFSSDALINCSATFHIFSPSLKMNHAVTGTKNHIWFYWTFLISTDI